MELILNYALRFVGTPYKWGGKNPLEGLDCSGLVQILLRAAAILPSSPVLSAQAIHDELIDQGCQVSDPKLGAIVFFGKSLKEIDHVGFCVDAVRMIEARGGDHTTLTLKDAIAKEAFVEIRPRSHRGDQVAVVMPNYQAHGL